MPKKNNPFTDNPFGNLDEPGADPFQVLLFGATPILMQQSLHIGSYLSKERPISLRKPLLWDSSSFPRWPALCGCSALSARNIYEHPIRLTNAFQAYILYLVCLGHFFEFRSTKINMRSEAARPSRKACLDAIFPCTGTRTDMLQQSAELLSLPKAFSQYKGVLLSTGSLCCTTHISLCNLRSQ